MAAINEATATWMAAAVPALHAAGAVSTAEILGTQFRWTMEHRAAVEDYATRTWNDVAARLRGIDRDTRNAIRGEVRTATRTALLDGKTATQAGREFAREAARNGIWSVEYANGARHTMRDYGDMVIRTTTAESYNRGSVTQSVQDGIEFIQYADGPGCGVSGHNDGTEANGMIVPIEDVVYLAHPNCRRACLPWTGLRGGPGGSDEYELGPERGEDAPVISMREPRAERVGRTPRGGRGDDDL